MFDERDKKSKLDGETKSFFKEIENREKCVDKKGFIKYLSYEPTTLVNKLLDQNTQDFKTNLDEIKQQNIKLNEEERNSTNNKNENDRLKAILSVIDRTDHFFEYKFMLGDQSDELKLPKWVKASQKRFDLIKTKVQNAKNNNLKARPNRKSLINFNESKKLLQNTEYSKINYEEALNRINNIRSDIKKNYWWGESLPKPG